MCSTITSSSNNKLSATMSRQPKDVKFFDTSEIGNQMLRPNSSRLTFNKNVQSFKHAYRIKNTENKVLRNISFELFYAGETI